MAHLYATGYVHEMLDDNLDFQEFAMRCARAFGALIEMRDEPRDAPIQRSKMSSYHIDEGKKATAEVKRFKAMTKQERLAYGEKEKKDALKRQRKALKETQGDLDQCNAMLEKVEAWEPPTAEHTNLKEFMREQLTKSIGDGTKYHTDEIAKLEKTPELKFWEEALRHAEWNVEYHAEEAKKEEARVESCNKWVDDLRDSLRKVK